MNPAPARRSKERGISRHLVHNDSHGDFNDAGLVRPSAHADILLLAGNWRVEPADEGGFGLRSHADFWI